jgi:hypothetical protein
MRISLKQTILLSTALFTMNLPLLAMEVSTDKNGEDKSKLVVTSDVPPPLVDESDLKKASSDVVVVNGPYLEKAKEFSTLFFGKEVPESFDVFQKIAELLDDKDSAFPEPILISTAKLDSATTTSISVLSTSDVLPKILQTEKEPIEAPSEQLALDSQKFTSGELTLIAEHFNLPHPDFNAIYTELADNFLETILPDGVKGKTSGTTETIKRLTKIHDLFKEKMDISNQHISEFNQTLIDQTTTDKDRARLFILTNQNKKKEFRERFQNLLNHFSETRKFIIEAKTTITSKETLITQASKAPALKNTEQIARKTIEELNIEITYLKTLIIDAETFIHALYDFDRTDLHLAQTSNPLRKVMVLLKSAISSGAGMVTNALNENRTLRYDMTGISVLPRSITISAKFNSQKCDGSVDQTPHERYIMYIHEMLKPTSTLFDALEGGRIKFAKLPEIVEKANLISPQTKALTTIAESKDGDGDADGDKKETEVKPSKNINALSITAAVINEPNSSTTVFDEVGSKDGAKKKKKDKKSINISTSGIETVIETDS